MAKPPNKRPRTQVTTPKRPAARSAERKTNARGGVYDDATLGKRLDELRNSRGMKVEEFCERMNAPDPEFKDIPVWSDGVYSRKHRGLTAISHAEMGKLAKILGLPYGVPYIEEKWGRLLDLARSDPALERLITELVERRR